MYRIRCAEVWGGIGDRDAEVCSGALAASVHCKAFDGERGGDIYYLSVCEKDDLTRIALADVTGHGPEVSDVSQWLYEVLESRMNEVDCDTVLGDLNRSAVEHGVDAMATAAVAGFFSSDSNLYFSYAGHAPFLLKRRGGGHWSPVDLDEGTLAHANAPLGVIDGSSFDQQQIRLATGDRLFFYTDGLSEAMSGAGELFGTDGLLQVLDASAADALPAVKERVLEAMMAHTGGQAPHDDVTLLAVEIR